MLMPISAPRPYSPPSAKRVEAFTITLAESTRLVNWSMLRAELLRMASVWWLPKRLM